MNLRIYCLIFLITYSVSLTDAGARLISRQRIEKQSSPQKPAIRNNIVELDLSYDFTVPGETRRISFIAALPTTIPDRQNIISTQISPKPSRIFQKNGNSYAEFVFDKPREKIEIEIQIKAELFQYDLFTAMKNPARDPFEVVDLTDFLRHEKYIEKDHLEIQQLADSIEGRTEEEIVNNIYNCVIDHLDYIKHGKQQWGALGALQEGKGDCSEYSDLFVALCRAKNIPARVVTGYTVRFDSNSPKHNWAEVYLWDYGWVPFEPSWGDIENVTIRNMAFSRMRPVYIYFSNIRSDEVLQNYHYASYKYWGDKVRLKDSVEFKQSDSFYSR